MTSQLTKALNRIISWIENHNSYYVKYLQPGLSKDEIDNLAKDLPFQLPLEIYELYQWKNGAILPELPKDHDLYGKGLIFKPGWSFRPLQEVIKIYLENDNDDEQKHLENQALNSPARKDCTNKFYIIPIFFTIRYYNI